MAIMNSKLGRMWKSCVVYLCFYLFQVQVLHGYASTSGKYVGRGHARRAHGSSCAHQAPLLLQRQGMNRYSNMRLYYIKYDDEEEGSGGKLGKEDEDMDVVEQKATAIVKALGKNPVARIVTNSYSFFWNFPKKTCLSILHGYFCGIAAQNSLAGINFRTIYRHIATWEKKWVFDQTCLRTDYRETHYH